MEDLDQIFPKIDPDSYGPHGFKDHEGGSIAGKRGPLVDGIPTKLAEFNAGVSCLAYEVSDKTALIPLDGIFPQCGILTKDTQIPRMLCVADPSKCHVGQNCMGTLLGRLGKLHSAFPKWDIIVLYWRLDKKLVGLAVRTNDTKLKLINVNPHSLDYFISRRSKKFKIQF